MVIHGTELDRQRIFINGLSIKHCDNYTYFGVIFTADGSTATSLKVHAADKKKQLNRPSYFCLQTMMLHFV